MWTSNGFERQPHGEFSGRERCPPYRITPGPRRGRPRTPLCSCLGPQRLRCFRRQLVTWLAGDNLPSANYRRVRRFAVPAPGARSWWLDEDEPKLPQRWNASSASRRSSSCWSCWRSAYGSAQDFVASFAARQMMARTHLWTPDKWDDARVQRAFQKARQTTRLEVTLERNANGFHPERHDYLTVIAPTRQEAIEGRRAVVEAIRAAFAKDGPGLLNIGREPPEADPVPNATTRAIRQGCPGPHAPAAARRGRGLNRADAPRTFAAGCRFRRAGGDARDLHGTRPLETDGETLGDMARCPCGSWWSSRRRGRP